MVRALKLACRGPTIVTAHVCSRGPVQARYRLTETSTNRNCNNNSLGPSIHTALPIAGSAFLLPFSLVAPLSPLFERFDDFAVTTAELNPSC